MGHNPPASSRNRFFRYLPVSERDRAWGIYVTTAGYMRVAAGETYPPQDHPPGYSFAWRNGRILPEFQLHYITRGGGVLESAAAPRRRIQSGSYFLLFPGVWHRYRPHEATGWDEYWVGFGGESAQRLVRAGFLSPREPVFQPAPEGGLLDLFDELIERLRSESFGCQQVVGSLTSLMLARLHAAKGSRAAEAQNAGRVIAQAKRLLAENLDRNLSGCEIARKLNVSHTWLRRQFRRHTGLPLHQYHLQLRLHRAMQLLSGAGLSVKEAAGQLGYVDPHYFSRLFKRKTGQAPEQWRRLARGEGPEAARPA